MATLYVRCARCHTLQAPSNRACKKCGLSFKNIDNRTVYVRYKAGGKDRYDKLGRIPLYAAREVKTKIETDLAEGRLDKVAPPPGSKIPAQEYLFGRYLEWCKANNRGWKQKLPYIRMVASYFEGKTLSEITAWDCELFKEWRLKTPKQRGGTPVKPATVNRALATLKHALNKAVEWGLIRENPASSVKPLKVENTQVDYLTSEEIEALLQACKGDLKDIVTVALGTGMRRGEILNLRWDQVDFRARVIHLTRTKSARARTVPMVEEVYQTLKRRKRETPKGQEFVFVNPRTGKPITDVKNGLKAAYKKAGISLKGRPFHLLRHTWASHLVMGGCDLYTLMELGGWQSIDMVKRYAHLSRQYRQQVMQSLEKSLFKKGGSATYMLHGEIGQKEEGP